MPARQVVPANSCQPNAVRRVLERSAAADCGIPVTFCVTTSTMQSDCENFCHVAPVGCWDPGAMPRTNAACNELSWSPLRLRHFFRCARTGSDEVACTGTNDLGTTEVADPERVFRFSIEALEVTINHLTMRQVSVRRPAECMFGKQIDACVMPATLSPQGIVPAVVMSQLDKTPISRSPCYVPGTLEYQENNCE